MADRGEVSDSPPDPHAWWFEQARALRAGRFEQVETRVVAHALDRLADAVEREAADHLLILIAHLLKWEFFPDLRGKGWAATIDTQRAMLARLLRRNPSVDAVLRAATAKAHSRATRRVARELDYPRDDFPWVCPYSVEQMLDPAFWPQPD